MKERKEEVMGSSGNMVRGKRAFDHVIVLGVL